MRLIVLLVAWMALFGLLLHFLPQGWAIPLYLLFLVVALFYVMRERRQILLRRHSLQDELDENRRELRESLRESRQMAVGEEE